MYFNDKTDCEEAAECYRQCIDFCDNASPEEKGRVDEYVMLADVPPGARRISKLFDELKANALEGLRQVESCAVKDSDTVQDSVRSPWSVYSRSVLVPIFGDIPTEQMERRLASGGATCDGCGVARGSTNRNRLFVCGKCNMGYYCSKECQVKLWKRGGHKEACRKPREFNPDDIVRYILEDLGQIAMIRLKHLVDGEEADCTLNWEAYCVTKDGELFVDVVEESKLRHIRPADMSSAIWG